MAKTTRNATHPSQKSQEPPPRSPRWCRHRLQGVLKALSPLHVGSGLDAPRTLDKEQVMVALVATGADGSPFIPGSAIKGRLHQQAREFAAEDLTLRAMMVKLFGEAKGEGGTMQDGQSPTTTEQSVPDPGGCLTFFDAPLRDAGFIPPLFEHELTQELPDNVFSKYPLHWDARRKTYIMASTAVDRVTGTVEPHKLYHFEAVPLGTTFDVVIGAEALTPEELAFLQVLLEQFNGTDGLTLGGLSAHGYGRVKWTLSHMGALDTPQKLKAWLDAAASPAAWEGFPILSSGSQEDGRLLAVIAEHARKFRDRMASRSRELVLTLRVEMEGPFSINDPSSCRKKKTAATQNQGTPPDHWHLRDEKGQPLLPGKSLHGALRSQAERIVRTCAGRMPITPSSPGPHGACFITSRKKDLACAPVTRRADVATLCATCRLFGGNGWKSPVTLSDFRVDRPEGSAGAGDVTQEFVAVDRFTGGAADGKKFNSHYPYRPVFVGTLSLDLGRIEAAHAGLLALTLKDFLEGDIPLGFKKNIGFGACRASVTEVDLPQVRPDWVTPGLLGENALWRESPWRLNRLMPPLDPQLTRVLTWMVEQFSHGFKPGTRLA